VKLHHKNNKFHTLFFKEIDKFRQKLKTVQADHSKLQTAYDERVRCHHSKLILSLCVVGYGNYLFHPCPSFTVITAFELRFLLMIPKLNEWLLTTPEIYDLVF